MSRSRFLSPFLLMILLLTACNLPRAWEPSESILDETETPIITSAYEGCYYVWAYQNLAEISEQVDEAIKEIQPQAHAYAQAFGENCVYADGHTTFGAMETDFYVTIPVRNLNDKEELGNWIIQVMKTLDRFPRGRVPGGQDGFAEITFQAQNERAVLRVSIFKYKNLPASISGAEVYRAFENPSD